MTLNKSVSSKSISEKFKVEGLLSPCRIDVYCTERLKNLSRSQLKSGLKSLFVNSKKTKLSRNVQNGDLIELLWDNPVPEYAYPQKLPLNIIYEDENIIVINKERGRVTHPAGGNWDGTLVNALNYYRLDESKIKDEFAVELNKFLSEEKDLKTIEKLSLDPYRMGIVHRLDKETSGLIITARNLKTENLLKSFFKKRAVKKYYLAVLDGVPPKNKGRIKTCVFRSSSDRKKFSVSADLTKGKIALSAYKVLKSNGKMSLVLFRIYTGRTHQIRLHAKFMGCPVAGDKVYGKKKAGLDKTGMPLMLHSYKLIVPAAVNQKKEFKAPIPNDFKQILIREALC
ncbi:RluA family pseudouridine synthase [Treponema putidum]|uniref:Pseudouridine synthase n=1 Tax=Treponema putidum TaxID=221027 RepID=A0AAE9SJ89_9SPIR|nr:RluA family pseudouridine synthase [Treponema putidum]AIN94122.1 pseudouridine synthase [Treponema putidum]TWI79575.1 23S rRNA pseudouridine1911/1915/1917 synthase [Treponema putidum]UTY30565.1 RluA family pseudouridine synthase [Treponema putidum]UTY32972.1 RluA family pseudouridine synthase [Treponema putidum]